MNNPHHIGTRLAVSLFTLFFLFFLVGCDLIDNAVDTISPPPAELPAPPAPIPTTTNTPTNDPTPTDEATPTDTLPDPTVSPTETPAPVALDLNVPRIIEQSLPPARSYTDLDQLWSVQLPEYDRYDIIRRLNPWLDIGSRTVVDRPLAVLGDTRDFRVDEGSREAELRAVTPNFQFWFETGMDVEQAKIDEIIGRLEDDLYPQLVALFGEPLSPGIDGDPRILILHLQDFGSYTDLGFFDSLNQEPITVDEDSNQAEILFMNMQDLKITDELYLGTLVHELHHLIHWSADANEDAWLDEGLAQVGEIALGFNTAETSDYFYDTSTPLTGWTDDENEVFKHYAVSYLFGVYLWERLGPDALQTIVADDANSLASVRNAIATYEPTATLESVLADWTVANWLDTSFYNPDHGYENLTIGLPEIEARVGKLPFETESGIPQYGVHYIQIQETGEMTLQFAGDSVAPLIPLDQPLETAVWFAPPQDNGDATLTTQLDLTSLNTATVEYEIWHEHEDEYDATYVLISSDNGETWEVIESESGMSSAEFAYAHTGYSDGWQTHTLNLDLFTGQPILLRFETITDFSYHEAGFALRQLTLQENGYTPQLDDYSADGFILTGDLLPQQWSVQLIQDKQVTNIPLNPYAQAQIDLNITDPNAVLIIMPQTPIVTTSATYWITLSR